MSFVALREMISISGFRKADRPALLVAFTTIPIQYYWAYQNQLTGFFAFIPIGMFMLIPFLLIGKGQTKAIGRSMALIPAILMLTVFTISHTALLYNIDTEIMRNTQDKKDNFDGHFMLDFFKLFGLRIANGRVCTDQVISHVLALMATV